MLKDLGRNIAVKPLSNDRNGRSLVILNKNLAAFTPLFELGLNQTSKRLDRKVARQNKSASNQKKELKKNLLISCRKTN